MTFTFVPGPHHLIASDTLGPIKTWSFSSLTKFERCAYAAYLGKVEGFKEPGGPAADRGTAIHNQWDAYIRGDTDVLRDAGKKPNLEYANVLREHYAEGRAHVEEEWWFDRDWTVTTSEDPARWAVFKLDVFVRESETAGRIIDHKSGKSWGNEVKHGEQGMFYGIAALMRFPELQYVTTEFNYVDEGHVLDKGRWRREDLDVFLPRLVRRANAYTCATDFPPTPSAHNCRWCRYKDEVKRDDGTPVCQWGVLA